MSYVVITLLLAVIFGLDGSHRLSSPVPKDSPEAPRYPNQLW